MKPISTAERTFFDLCDEVDFWRERAEYWEGQYKEERDRNIKEQNERFEESKKGVANALMLAFSVRDNEDGSLSISKEDRKELAANLR